MKDLRVLDFGAGGLGSAFEQRKLQNGGDTRDFYSYDSDLTVQQALKEEGFFYDFWRDDSLLATFDMIVANQVYEHLDRQERIDFIQRSADLLKSGGRMVIAYPFVLYNMNFKYFWEDITHNPVGVEAEAGFIEQFGFRCNVYVAGLKGDPLGILENIICLLRNLLLLFPPFWITVVEALKVETGKTV
ncbi:MAG: methyltransferase domain-containing protein [Dehalococcoidia bacterium]